LKNKGFALPKVVWQEFVGEAGTLTFFSVKFLLEVVTKNYINQQIFQSYSKNKKGSLRWMILRYTTVLNLVHSDYKSVNKHQIPILANTVEIITKSHLCSLSS